MHFREFGIEDRLVLQPDLFSLVRFFEGLLEDLVKIMFQKSFIFGPVI